MSNDDNINDDGLEEIEDFDIEDGDDDDNFDDFSTDGVTLGDTFRDKPIFKFGAIAAILILIVAVFIFFRSGPPTPRSTVPGSSNVDSTPGRAEVSQNYEEAIKEEDRQRLEEAKLTGSSVLPTPIETPVGRIPLQDDEQEEEDPLERWRRLQQERAEQEAERANLLQPDELQTNFISDDVIQAMADAMAAQMQIILEGLGDVPLEYSYLTGPEYLEGLREAEEEDAANALLANNNTTLDANGNVVALNGLGEIAEIILPAGEIAYGQLLLEANSDVPGPVLAQIAGGPLNGARVLGSFNVAGSRLTLEFNTIVIDGISQGIEAIAIDPGTTLPGLATDFNPRILKRVVLPAAAAFIEGAAQAISDSGRTTLTITGDSATSVTENDNVDTEEEIASGIEEAAEEIGELLDEEADNTRPLVKIRSGTPIGLLFLQPVIKE